MSEPTVRFSLLSLDASETEIDPGAESGVLVRSIVPPLWVKVRLRLPVEPAAKVGWTTTGWVRLAVCVATS